MVYSARCEQQMKFEVHNAHWEPVDLDGILLMRRPLPKPHKAEDNSTGLRKAEPEKCCSRVVRKKRAGGLTMLLLTLKQRGFRREGRHY